MFNLEAIKKSNEEFEKRELRRAVRETRLTWFYELTTSELEIARKEQLAGFSRPDKRRR